MKVNICGLMHEIVESEDAFDVDMHLGQINYKELKILINKNIPNELKEETICHEMVHGMLTHLGFYEEAQNEQFVQSLSNAIYQGFSIKKEEQ